MSQITGNDDDRTEARFPNLLNQVKMQIAVSALRKAQDNYNAKLNTAIAEATRDADLDVAQYMCQMLPVTNGSVIGATTNMPTDIGLSKPYSIATTNMPTDIGLSKPYSISYEVARGLNANMLAMGGSSSRATSQSGVLDTTAGSSQAAEIINSFTGLGSNRVKTELPGGTREMWSLFSRETRICHYCVSTITKTCSSSSKKGFLGICSSSSKKGFLGIGASNSMECTESEPIEECRDIQM